MLGASVEEGSEIEQPHELTLRDCFYLAGPAHTYFYLIVTVRGRPYFHPHQTEVGVSWSTQFLQRK